MASRYHWLSAGIGLENFTIGQGIPSRTITIPAGGRLLKVITQHLYIYRLNTTTQNSVEPLYWSVILQINSTQYPFRTIYQADFATNFEMVSLGSGLYYYVAWGPSNGQGVQELNCSYGGPGKAAIVLTQFANLTPLDNTLTGTARASGAFRALYYL
jgi:hypothetical protein